MVLTRSPVSPHPKVWFSLDLHVLGAPPAFVLSQDQTLRLKTVVRGADRKGRQPRACRSVERWRPSGRRVPGLTNSCVCSVRNQVIRPSSFPVRAEDGAPRSQGRGACALAFGSAVQFSRSGVRSVRVPSRAPMGQSAAFGLFRAESGRWASDSCRRLAHRGEPPRGRKPPSTLSSGRTASVPTARSLFNISGASDSAWSRAVGPVRRPSCPAAAQGSHPPPRMQPSA